LFKNLLDAAKMQKWK
ncbi:hypothetical protein COW57_02190, partial [Candidatus Roizmanbacteria bacterium CG17_big_fil_post_rev_8_21_14_2_50_39_7]